MRDNIAAELMNLKKRTMDEMITYFNDVVSEMNIPCKDKMTLLGMITAIGYEAQNAADVRPVVLCKDCKHKGWVQEPEHGKSVDYCRLIERCVDKQFFCAAGERKPTA